MQTNPLLSQKAYLGPEKFVISMDIGTTHSERRRLNIASAYMSFSFSLVCTLSSWISASIRDGEPLNRTCLGGLTSIKVTRWPGQTELSADAKVGSSKIKKSTSN
jgi:hypothetical protein